MSTTVNIYKRININGDRAKDNSQKISIVYTDKLTHKIQSFVLPLENISTIECFCGELRIRNLDTWFYDNDRNESKILDNCAIDDLYRICTELIELKDLPMEFNTKLSDELGYALGTVYQENIEEIKKEIGDVVGELEEMLEILDNIKKDPLWKTYDYSYTMY